MSRRFSIAHLALLVPWIALVIDAGQPVSDNSFLWHVRAGELQVQRGSVLTEDPFSFTMEGSPWLTQSWLIELFYGWAEGLWGLGFVPPMLLIVSTLTFVGIGITAFRHSRSVPATAFVMVLSTLALISFLVPRPVLFSFLMMVLVIVAWHRPQSRWSMPFLFWIWASLHASFLIGIGYVGLNIIMRKEWKAIPIAIPSSLTVLATAHGVGVIKFLIEFGENREALQYLSEWRKPELLSVVFLPFFGGLVFAVLGAFRDRIQPRHLWILVPFTVLAFTSVRAIPPAWLAIIPIVAISLGGIEIGLKRGLRPQLALVFALVVAILPFLLITPTGLDEERFPVDAVAYLEDVRTFHDDRAGGYLIWAAWPERRVYLDDRAELYGPRMEEFVEVREKTQDWQPIFERDQIEQALLPTGEPLVDDLDEAGWETIYADSTYTVMRPGQDA